MSGSRAGSTKTTWSPEQYERAMSYKGRVSGRVCERLTGIPAPTVIRWWRGVRPKFMYTEAQKAGEYAVPKQHPAKPSVRRRRILASKRRYNRKYKYRRAGVFHPEHNPDLSLAPLHNLWVLAEDMVALVRESYSDEEVVRIFPKNSHAQNNWYALTSGRKKWLRFDAADRILSELALNPVGLAHPPTYSTRVPKEKPC
jgi:hypothetical protein